MNENNLTLRQRQILNILFEATDYLTGNEISKRLNVSSRTIRNDISAINLALADDNITILSKHSFGYKLQFENSTLIKQYLKANESYLSRTERIRHIAYVLCNRHDPVDLDILADAMYISRTTLDNDLSAFKDEYVKKFSLRLNFKNNSVSMEAKERIKRRILLHLYSQNWNYSGRENTYFEFEHIEKRVFDICTDEIQSALLEKNIIVEDVNLVHLNLMISIAYTRMNDGFLLEKLDTNILIPQTVQETANTFFYHIEQKLNCTFNEIERQDISEMLAYSIVVNREMLEKSSLSAFFANDLIRFTNRYLMHLKEIYGIDLIDDSTFYLELLCYFRYLKLPVHNLNYDSLLSDPYKRMIQSEIVIAMTIQPFAKTFYGRFFDELEIYYLSHLLSGGIARLAKKKFHAILLSHYNFPIGWSLCAKLEVTFKNQLIIDHVYPVYMKNWFVKKNTDLVLITANKPLDLPENIEVIRVSPSLDAEDVQSISEFIHKESISNLYRNRHSPIYTQLRKATWHEDIDVKDLEGCMQYLGQHFFKQKAITLQDIQHVLKREKQLSYFFQDIISVLYFPLPCQKTRIEVMTLHHRIRINNKKIRLIIMISATKIDQDMIIKFIHSISNLKEDLNEARFLKTKKEWLPILKQHLGDE